MVLKDIRHKILKELEIRILDHAVMFVAIDRSCELSHNHSRTAFFISNGFDENLMFKDSTGEFKMSYNELEIDKITNAIAHWINSNHDLSALRTSLKVKRSRESE